jgi:hypothetical protein
MPARVLPHQRPAAKVLLAGLLTALCVEASERPLAKPAASARSEVAVASSGSRTGAPDASSAATASADGADLGSHLKRDAALRKTLQALQQRALRVPRPRRRVRLASSWAARSPTSPRWLWRPTGAAPRGRTRRTPAATSRGTCLPELAGSSPTTGSTVGAGPTRRGSCTLRSSARCSTEARETQRSPTPTPAASTGTPDGIGRSARCSSFRRRGSAGAGTVTATGWPIRRTCSTPRWEPASTFARRAATCTPSQVPRMRCFPTTTRGTMCLWCWAIRAPMRASRSLR